jgi:hypothetical protein
MSRVLITIMKGKDTKTLTYSGVKSIIINNGGRKYLVAPARIDVGNTDGNSNTIRINTRSGAYDLPIDLNCRYIVVWYDKDDNIIAHADIDGRFVHALLRAWP